MKQIGLMKRVVKNVRGKKEPTVGKTENILTTLLSVFTTSAGKPTPLPGDKTVT